MIIMLVIDRDVYRVPGGDTGVQTGYS